MNFNMPTLKLDLFSYIFFTDKQLIIVTMISDVNDHDAAGAWNTLINSCSGVI